MKEKLEWKRKPEPKRKKGLKREKQPWGFLRKKKKKKKRREIYRNAYGFHPFPQDFVREI